MKRRPHTHPDECLLTLPFSYGEAGRSDYFNLMGLRLECAMGDCAIVALAYAAPIPYQTAYDSLELDTAMGRLWRCKRYDETLWDYIARRIRECLTDTFRPSRAHHRNPLYGTHIDGYGHLLKRDAGYRLVFGQPGLEPEYCLCSNDADYVVDGKVEGKDHHVAAIVDGNVLGTTDITCDNFRVFRVWRRDSQGTDRRGFWFTRG